MCDSGRLSEFAQDSRFAGLNYMDTIRLTADDGSVTEFYIEEQTRIGGTDYLLVADSPDGDANALILKDVSGENDTEASLVPVEDEDELEALLKVFAEILDDTDIRM